MNSTVTKLTEANFDAIKGKGTVLIDFYATWCSPCSAQAPILDKLAKELGDKVSIGKLNVDDYPEIASQYSVMSLPTLLILKNGQVKNTFVGLQSEKVLKKALDNA